MADKFFHEFIQTISLKDTDLLLIDQNNETRTVELSTIKQYVKPPITSTVQITDKGLFLPAGTNQSYTVPNGVSQIEIIAHGHGGIGKAVIIGGGGSMRNSQAMIGINIFGGGFTIPDVNVGKLTGTPYGGGAGNQDNTKMSGAGGGAGAWVKKTLTVTDGQTFTYSSGIPSTPVTISSGSWSMTAGTGAAATYSSFSARAGIGGIASGTYDEGYNGQNASGYNGGINRTLNGVISNAFGNYIGGYIFIRIVK